MPPIRILIADDHLVVRRGIRALLSTESDMEVVGETSNGLETVRLAQSLDPDVILMDIMMPQMNGIEATRQIAVIQPHVRILVLTSFAADDKVLPAIKAGAHGCLLKDSSPADLVQAIRQVHHGEVFLPPVIAFQIVQELSATVPRQGLHLTLTEYELDVLLLVVQGLRVQDIAALLHIEAQVVHIHMRHALDKFHQAHRHQATV